MPSDYQLYLEWKTEYKTFSGADTARFLSTKYDLSEDSVRGRLSRANTIENRVKVSKHLSQPREVDESIMVQENIISASVDKWQKHLAKLDTLDRPAVGYFISDLHRGAPFRHDYWRLTLEILSREQNVDVISALNDWQDNEGWGRWDDTRPSKEKAWSDDVRNSFNVENHDYETLRDLTGAQLVGIAGNHDLWIFNYWRSNSPQSAESHVADRMKELFGEGVLLFNRMSHQNAIHLSKGLVWEHGTSASKRASGRARAHLPKYMKNGQAKSVVVGHSHRPILLNGSEVDYHGVWFANAGTYYRHDDVRYSPTHQGVGWTGAIVRCEFKPSSNIVDMSLIEFRDRGSSAVAIRNGTVVAETDLDGDR